MTDQSREGSNSGINGGRSAEDAAPGGRRHRSRRVHLQSRRDYRSGKASSGRLRPSRRRRLKKIFFQASFVALLVVLGAAYWHARRKPQRSFLDRERSEDRLGEETRNGLLTRPR
jgi:hypothetical protein